MKTYWKLARPDGWDFYTGKTINYRKNIGKTVEVPEKGTPMLCSDTVLHACKTLEQCFVGARIPCSVFKVTGKPVVGDKKKKGFTSLKVLEECDPNKVLRWRYSEVVSTKVCFRVVHVNIVSMWRLPRVLFCWFVGHSWKEVPNLSGGHIVSIDKFCRRCRKHIEYARDGHMLNVSRTYYE